MNELRAGKFNVEFTTLLSHIYFPIQVNSADVWPYVNIKAYSREVKNYTK